MAYYTAVLTRSGGQWQLRPSDIDAPEDLAEVSDAVRTASRGHGGLAIVEREDDWFAIIRVDGEDDPRVFVSDLPAARQGPFAVLFEDVEEWERTAVAGAADGQVSGVSAGEAEGGAAGAADDEGLAGVEAVEEVDDEDDGSIDEVDRDIDELLDGEGLADADALDRVDDLEAVDGLDEAVEADEDHLGVGVTVPKTAAGGGGRPGVPAPEDRVALAAAQLEQVVWAGDLGVLEDYGLAPQTLKVIVEEGDPAAALLAIGEQVGFADVIDEWH